jgi:hypothetical protein
MQKLFNFSLINAQKSIEDVQKDILREFQYQGSFELGEDTFENLSRVPLVEEVYHSHALSLSLSLCYTCLILIATVCRFDCMLGKN